MMLPNSPPLPPAKFFADEPSERNPTFPNKTQPTLAPYLVIPKRLMALSIEVAETKGDAPTLVQPVLPKRLPVAD